MVTCVQERYEPAIRPARRRFATHPVLATCLSGDVDPAFLELFLIHFSSLGVGLTQPVEDWLRRAARRCDQVGLADLGRALRGHAKQESGHHLMMIADTHALVARWNAARRPRLDAERLLARVPTPGGRMYRQLHEDTIAGDTPFVQIAVEYEIEMLPVQFGPPLLERCRAVLGSAITAGLSFLHEHITLDVAHTRFNEHQLEKLLQSNPAYLEPLVRAGGAALAAYGTFLNDCLELTYAEFAEPAGADA
jgi:hypothetical protein